MSESYIIFNLDLLSLCHYIFWLWVY